MSTFTAPPMMRVATMFAAIAIAQSSGNGREVMKLQREAHRSGIKTGNRKSSSGPLNQRQRRKYRRQRWAAGDRHAFSR